MKIMFKGIAFAALLSSSSVMAQTETVFDFMGFDTETVVAKPSIAGKTCSDKGEGERSCTLYNTKLADARASIIMVNFYDGKLSSVLGIADRREYLSLLSAFTAKYGSPKMETRVWQNRAGAKLDNQVAIWQFKGGDLELSQIGSRSSNTDFQFFSSTNMKPAEAPEVNF